MNDSPTFFDVQERALGMLQAWGLSSMAASLPLFASRNPVLRHAGLQALSWGAIDALLAVFGRRGARNNQAMGATDSARQARRFRLILLANALLDVGYIAGGLALLHRARGRADRAGMGLGIIPQGVFLLGFDTLLGWYTGRWTREEIEDA